MLAGKVLWCCWVTCSMRKWNMEHLDCNCLSFVLVRRRIKNKESSCNSRFARFLVVDDGDDGDEDSTWMNDG